MQYGDMERTQKKIPDRRMGRQTRGDNNMPPKPSEASKIYLKYVRYRNEFILYTGISRCPHCVNFKLLMSNYNKKVSRIKRMIIYISSC